MRSWARCLISLSLIFILFGLDQLLSLFSCIWVISFLIPASRVLPFLLCKWFPLSSPGWPSFGGGASTDLTLFSPDFIPHYLLSVLLCGRTENLMFVLGLSPASLSNSLPSPEIRESGCVNPFCHWGWISQSVLEAIESKLGNRCQQVKPLIPYANHSYHCSISKGLVTLLPSWCALPTSASH